MDKVTVDAAALRQVLAALAGPDHHVRELQYTRSIPGNPINTLIDEYNAQVEAYNAQSN